MKRLNSLSATVVAISLLAPSAAFAAPASIHVPVNAMFAKTKTIHFKLLNDSSSTMELKVGDDVVKLDAGKSLSVNLPVGARVLCSSTTPLHQSGSVIAEVTNSLDGAIVHVK
ncbi:MAG TPA: hypothetical protein VK578_12245 [Edaphobacter sp.]|jgi:hypothetical protein|nr:hypothetical protein [Edaphobacter sp.]